MNEFLKSWKTYVIGLVVAVSIGGLGAAADNRWLQKASFQEWVEADYRQELSAEIRQLDRQINRAESEIAWADDEVKAFALQERINLLEEQKADLERELESQ